MTDHEGTYARIATLERKVSGLSAFVLILMAILVMGICLSFRKLVEAQSSDRILRVRGLIIEDDAGRERILIGAPTPSAQNRVRTDEARVRDLWGKRYPDADRYMDFYKNYQHATNGILILDEHGFDRNCRR
jgi:hypothetical protein